MPESIITILVTLTGIAWLIRGLCFYIKVRRSSGPIPQLFWKRIRYYFVSLIIILLWPFWWLDGSSGK